MTIFHRSSLELAPSLLNIYDDIVASGTRDDNGNECLLDDVSANKSSSPPLHHHQNTCVGKTQSLPPRTDGKIPLRSGKLPSLSEPSDRPVSMMDTDPSAPKQNQDHNDQKKRPLSISSMSSASSSSLPRLRKKRANMMKSATNDSRDTGIPDEEAEEASGFSSSAGGSGGNADGSGLGSESRNSVDSGCVDGDRSGERFFDNMSITSSETGSTRDEVDSSLWSGKDVSLTSVDTTMSSKQQQSRSKLLGNSSHPTPHVLQQTPSPSPYRKYSQDKATNENLGSLPDSPLSPRLTRPRRISSPLSGSISIPKPEDPRLLGDKASYLASPSPTSPAPDSPSGYDVIGSPDNGRRTLSSTRQEARKRFFSNYEEHLNQNRTGYVQAPLAESESLTSSAHEDSPETRCEASGSEPSLLSSQKTAASAAATKKQSSSPSSSPSSPPATTSTPSSASEATQQQQNHIPPFSPSSEKRSSDKHFRDKRSSRYDPNSSGMTSQRSVFSRSSKKRDTHPGADPGSRGSPVYVSYVQRVVTEIIESERTYIASLEDIIHGYLEPLETILNTRDAKKDISCLFSNIREIYKFGCIFLADLERTGSDPVKVAQCFVRHNKGFVIYTDYCTNYPRAVEVLTKFMQDPDLSELCKERQLALGHGLPLGAFLLRPVQRILKYHLLLQNIVKNCEKEGQDASILEAAFQHMTQMAHHINEMKRKHEHAVRIQEIQSQLEDYVGEDLTRLGELVLESTFRVYGAKASRQVFLFEKGLLISKKKEGGMLSCKTFIMCSNLMLVEVIPNEPLSFHVIPFNNPRAQYTLQARNMEQKRRWCQEVKRLILESFKGRIPDNVKNLVMQLGREHDDDYVTKEALEAVRKNQHTAPEYLEKRRVRKKSGSRIPDFILLKPQRARKDWNKKADKSKVSPEMGRRAESKSPDSHRRIFPKQLAPNKRRSQSQCTSMPTTPTSEISYPEMYNQPHPSRPQAVSQPVTPSQNPISAIVSSGAALVSFTKGLGGDDVSKKDKSKSKVTNNNSREGHEEELEKVKRAQSFRKAMRSQPLTSQDLSDLVARCGGSIKFSTPNKVKEDVFTEDVPDRQDLSGYSLRSRSDAEDSSDEGGDEEEDSIDNKSALKSEETSFDRDMISVDSIADEDVDDTKPIHTSATFDSPGDVKIGALGVEDNDMMSPEARSASLPSLHNSERNSGFQADSSKRSRTNQLKSEKMSSYSSDNITSHRGSGRMSRRDMQNASLQNGRYGQRKGQGTAGSCDKVKDENSERKVTAFHDTYSKRTGDKAILRKKGLRLPNTSKHLPLPEPRASPHPNGIKAKLTDWNSGVDKLTKGSLSDISHLDEDPWVINSDSTSPGTSVSESLNSTAQDLSINDSSHAHGGARPRGHSDLSEMMKVSGNKENLDWLVYLNRNSYGSPSEAASASKQRLSTSALDWGCQRKENLDAKRRISAQVPYATPPRSYMTTENMKKFGSGKDKPQNFQSNGNKSTINVVPVSSVSAFGVPPMTITIARPTTLNASNLTRCNSIPASTCSRPETVTRVRPSSMDMEKLADESDRMVAEMEEYISRTSSSESMKGTSKFPTTLPTITVEEEEDDKELNRLSVVSSVSTSSYDSQASSSSDGLVGTLKTKLHTWAQRMGKREDSEISLTSTLTSDEEDKVDMFTGANTFEPPLHKENLWQADRQLESVLREHCQGGSVIGSRMAHTLPKGMESPTLHHHGDTVSSSSEARPHSTCGLSRVDTCQQVQDEQASPAKESAPDHARFSLPPTTEATEALMPPALKSCDIQQSDSGFSLQSNDSNLSETQTPAPEPLPQPLLELSEDSSKEVTPETKPKMDKSSKSKQSSPSAKSSVKRTDSCESIDSTDSFYERRLSVAFDSEVFNEEPVIVTVYEDRPQGHVEVQPRKHTIREYVQLIEQKLKPQSPKVFEVRRREPGTMIRQRLETLRESALYGRSSSSHGSSRQASEEREFIRSKSQPPSQYRTKLNSADRYDCRCSDDISVNGIRHFSSKESLSKSRERINLSKSRESVNSNLSRESLVTSKSREKINFGGSESSDSKPSSPALRIRSTNHGHESDSSRFLFMSPGPSEPSTANQFRYRARSNSDQPLSETERSPTPGAEGGMQPSKSMCKLDQLSSEVDNLVIMKGWVRALISRFQEPSES
ncbi:uncharacterized protein LOC101855581 isoform X2 [Aplysia californica]|uniref:Uncharacterized protein LOC101855581 isoform X2 n=1 Tax=Aplysia californica TaxID=6500 RepID=A0ABM1VWX6_APLCA|nr:uncharacterized protein LOC101855581 isoform X2 [Aplysia californica]